MEPEAAETITVDLLAAAVEPHERISTQLASVDDVPVLRADCNVAFAPGVRGDLAAVPRQLGIEAAVEQEPRRVTLWGLDLDAFTEDEAVASIVMHARRGSGGCVLTPNVDILRRFRIEPDARRHLASARFLLADGTPLVWASRIARRPLPERVAGSSMTWALCEAAASAGVSVFLLGGEEGVAERARDVLATRYPGLTVAGVHCPPMGFDEDQTGMRRALAPVVASGADIVLVALPFPKQCSVMAELRLLAPRTITVGVGISLSFVTGDVRRAPVVIQRLGFEWLHRMVQEPRRLFQRYLIEDMPYAVGLLAWSVRQRFFGA